MSDDERKTPAGGYRSGELLHRVAVLEREAYRDHKRINALERVQLLVGGPDGRGGRVEALATSTLAVISEQGDARKERTEMRMQLVEMRTKVAWVVGGAGLLGSVAGAVLASLILRLWS